MEAASVQNQLTFTRNFNYLAFLLLIFLTISLVPRCLLLTALGAGATAFSLRILRALRSLTSCLRKIAASKFLKYVSLAYFLSA